MNIEAIYCTSAAQKIRHPDVNVGSHVDKMSRLCPIFQGAVQIGVDVYPPFDCEVTWLGGTNFDVRMDGKEVAEYIWAEEIFEAIGIRTSFWCSKIPGVFQLDPGVIYATEPGIKLLLVQPSNQPYRDCWIQSGVLDSDWFHAPSAINIQWFEPNVAVKFSKNKPVARLIPVDTTTVAHIKVEDFQIQDRADCLNLWKGYIEKVYGADFQTNPIRLGYGHYNELRKTSERAR